MEGKIADAREHLQAKSVVVKKLYATPTLRLYGEVHQFTQGSGGMASDGDGTMTMMVV